MQQQQWQHLAIHNKQLYDIDCLSNFPVYIVQSHGNHHQTYYDHACAVHKRSTVSEVVSSIQKLIIHKHFSEYISW